MSMKNRKSTAVKDTYIEAFKTTRCKFEEVDSDFFSTLQTHGNELSALIQSLDDSRCKLSSQLEECKDNIFEKKKAYEMAATDRSSLQKHLNLLKNSLERDLLKRERLTEKLSSLQTLSTVQQEDHSLEDLRTSSQSWSDQRSNLTNFLNITRVTVRPCDSQHTIEIHAGSHSYISTM